MNQSSANATSHINSSPIQNQIQIRNPNPNQDQFGAPNEHINITLNVKKTVITKVSKEDAVKKLKQILCKEGVSEMLQEMVYKDRILEDEHMPLEFYGVINDCEIKVDMDTTSSLSKRLYIKLPFKCPRNIVKVHVSEDDNVFAIKSVIMFQEGLDVDEYDLMFNGKFLRNHQLMYKLKIPNDSLLYLVPKPKEVQRIRVSTSTRGTFTMEVKKNQTIGDLRRLLTSMTNSQFEDSKLMISGNVIADYWTIASCEIPENHVIELKAAIPINVKLRSENLLVVHVYPEDDVKVVIGKILKKLKLPLAEFPLIFNDMSVPDGQPISAYGVKEGSTLIVGPNGP